MEKNARGWGGYEGSRHARIDVNVTAIARELNLERMVKKNHQALRYLKNESFSMRMNL